jgi:hypothetical protein
MAFNLLQTLRLERKAALEVKKGFLSHRCGHPLKARESKVYATPINHSMARNLWDRAARPADGLSTR